MDTNLICEVILAQRAALYQFRKETSLNRSEIEIMCYGRKYLVFNTYQVREFFQKNNPQQTIGTIKKLAGMKVLQRLTYGTKGKPSLYILSEHGKNILNQYFDAFKIGLSSPSLR